jgi:hypothetical protein
MAKNNIPGTADFPMEQEDMFLTDFQKEIFNKFLFFAFAETKEGILKLKEQLDHAIPSMIYAGHSTDDFDELAEFNANLSTALTEYFTKND